MSAGASLREGTYRLGHLSDDEMWSAFAYLFSSKSKQSASYKYGFLKSILDNLYNTDDHLVLTFDQLFSKFAEDLPFEIIPDDAGEYVCRRVKIDCNAIARKP